VRTPAMSLRRGQRPRRYPQSPARRRVRPLAAERQTDFPVRDAPGWLRVTSLGRQRPSNVYFVKDDTPVRTGREDAAADQLGRRHRFFEHDVFFNLLLQHECWITQYLPGRTVHIIQWFLTWGPRTRVPNANLGGPKRKSGISTNLPQYFCLALVTSCFCVHTMHPILFSQPFQLRLLFLPLLSLVYLFGRAAIKVETIVRLPGELFLLTHYSPHLLLVSNFLSTLLFPGYTILYSGAHSFSILTWGSQTTSVAFRGSQQ